MKRYGRLVAIMLLLALVGGDITGVSAGSPGSVSSEPGVSDYNITGSKSIKEMEKEIKKAEEERKDLKNGLSDVKKIVANLEKEKSDLTNYVSLLDKEVEEIEGKIETLRNNIEEKEEQIVETEAQLVEAQNVEAMQYDAMSKRIRLNYEQGESFVVSLLFSSTSFGDFLNRSAYVKAVADYDNRQLDSFIDTREYVETCKRKLEEERLTLQATKEGMESEIMALESLIEEKAKEIESYETDIKTKEKAIREYEQEIKAQDQMIRDLEKAVEEEKKRQEAANKQIIYDGGTFKFPLESYTRISDDYGYRIHPTLNVRQFHNGVDFAAPKGTKIYAAYDGCVVAAAYSKTMGNYVMIDHGGGLYTIYMHASKLCVSSGDMVTKGMKIAEVGSTGRSTGNHLHFGVRLNGEYVSPWNYLSK